MIENNFNSDNNLGLNLLDSTQQSNSLNLSDIITSKVVSFDNELSLAFNSITKLEVISEQAIEKTYSYLNYFAQDSNWKSEI